MSKTQELTIEETIQEIIEDCIEDYNEDYSEIVDYDGFLKIQTVNKKEFTNEAPVEIKKKRGSIYSLNGDKLIHSMKFLDEYIGVDVEFPVLDYETTLFIPAYEGTLLRFFYHEEAKRWYLCTQNKLSAFNSYWGDGNVDVNSFGSIFEDALLSCQTSLIELCDSLDKSKVYLFNVLSTVDNRVVSDVPDGVTRKKVYHLGTFNWGDDTNLLMNEFDTSKETESSDSKETETKEESSDSKSETKLNDKLLGGRPRIANVDQLTPVKFKNETEFKENLIRLCPNDCQGYIAITKDNRMIKFITERYKLLSDVRGNIPSLMDRYLEVKDDDEMVNKLYSLYPDSIKDFEYYKIIVNDIAKNLHRIYLLRYLEKEQIFTHPDIHKILKEANQKYFKDKQKTTVKTFHNLLSQKNNSFILKGLVRHEVEHRNK